MAYKIIPLCIAQEYIYLIILCDSHSPYDYIKDIAHDVLKKGSGNILIDQLLHVGNTNKRFISFTLHDGELHDGVIAAIPKGSPYRKTTCEFLKDNSVMDSSILTSIQKRMINKGIVI